MKKFFIKDFGCKVNQYEGQQIREYLVCNGYLEVDDPADHAFTSDDVVVVNTCVVTRRSESKCLRLIKRVRSRFPQVQLIVTGCGVEDQAGRIRGLSAVSYYVPNERKTSFLDHMSVVSSDRNCGACSNPISSFRGHTRAFVKVQDGCNYACSYCIVPLLRGRSRSRSVVEVVEEVIQLTDNAFKEIVLCGIHLGSYGRDLSAPSTLAHLVKEVAANRKVERIRLSSLDPVDVNDALLEVCSQEPRLCPHFHFSLQSGDDYILKKMARRYTFSHYSHVVERIRSIRPETALTTDVIVGFPGETEEHFERTLHAIREIGFSRVHVFPYSSRPGTKAATYQGVCPQVVRERTKKAQAEVLASQRRFMSRFINTVRSVLVERVDQGTDRASGYTDNYLPVMIQSRDLAVGAIVPVQLVSCTDAAMIGEIKNIE